MSSKVMLLIFFGTVMVAGLGLYFLAQHPASGAETTSVKGVNCTSYSSSYTVVASETGYNDSISHGVPKNHWPVLCVHTGQTISITVLNRDSVEPHGFAVRGYYEGGVAVLPGQSVTVSFFADKPGDYQIFCNVICAIHPFMLSGILVVSP